MGLLSRSLGIQALSLEDPSQPLLPPSALFESLGLGRSDAGVMINEVQAMRISTAQTCVKIISEDLASNNHEIFQNMPDGSMRLASEHPYWPLIHDYPNETMTAKVFWGAFIACQVGWGNAYAWIKRDGGARIKGFVLLAPGKTAPVKIQGRLMYATTQTDTGAVAYLDPINVLHIMGVSFDGITGMSPVRTCMNAFGLAMATEKFGAQFFGNGARATGVFTYPGVLEEEAQENLQKSLREKATGENALRPMILEEGLKWTQTSIPPNEAQFIATRQYQRTEIAGMYRVPLHLVGDLQRATNNNIEHQSLDYIRYCLRPIAVGLEQEINRKVLGGKSYIMEHNFNDMMRGDFASQTAGFQILRGNGIYSANDCLRAMRQNPIPAEEGGDIRIVQGAMIPLSSLVREEGEPAALETAETDSGEGEAQPFNRFSDPKFDRIAPQFTALIRDAARKIIRHGVGDEAFAYQVMRPAVIALAQAVVSIRFACSELTLREMDLVDMQVRAIASATTGLDERSLRFTAHRLVHQVYGAFAGEVLQ